MTRRRLCDFLWWMVEMHGTATEHQVVDAGFDHAFNSALADNLVNIQDGKIFITPRGYARMANKQAPPVRGE
jgi:hypothetical protein